MNKEPIKEKLTTLLSGMPEIRIARLVRRSHSVKVCPHKGNCLTEKEMVSKLHCLLVGLLKAQNQDLLKKIEGMMKKLPYEGKTDYQVRLNLGYKIALRELKQLLK